MEILQTTGRDVLSFLLSARGIPVLLLIGLLIYVRKYLAATFCFVSISYITGLMSLGKQMNVYEFPLSAFLGFVAVGLLLLAWLGYSLFIRSAPRVYTAAPRRESTIFREPGPPTIIFDKHASSVFMSG